MLYEVFLIKIQFLLSEAIIFEKVHWSAWCELFKSTTHIISLEVMQMINIGTDHEKEMICDLFFNQVKRLTQNTLVKQKKRGGRIEYI